MEAAEKRPKTVRAYRDRVEKFVEYLGRHGIELAGVDTEKVNHYMEYLLIKRRQAAGTRSQVFYAIKKFFDFLMERGAVEENPVKGARRIKVERRISGCLTNDEVSLLIHAPGLKTEIGMRDTAILTFMTAVGPRASAVCGLRLGDIRAEEITVPPRCSRCGQTDYSGRSTLPARKKHVAIVTIREKGGKRWDVPMHDKAYFYLSQYIAHRERAKNSDIVFPAYSRHAGIRQLNRHGLYRLVRKHAARAGIKGRVTPHSLRRAAITWLLDCGVDSMVVRNLVGHSYLTTTEMYRAVTHRSFTLAGVATEKSLLEAIETPMDGLLDGIRK